jgi:hypothetical protein
MLCRQPAAALWQQGRHGGIRGAGGGGEAMGCARVRDAGFGAGAAGALLSGAASASISSATGEAAAWARDREAGALVLGLAMT